MFATQAFNANSENVSEPQMGIERPTTFEYMNQKFMFKKI